GSQKTGSREVHGLKREETALEYQLRHENCTPDEGNSGTKNRSFAATNPVFWKHWQHWEVPQLFDVIIEFRLSSTSGGLAENIKPYKKAYTTSGALNSFVQSLVGICLSVDNTFKAASKATVAHSSKTRTKLMKGGILSVLNECNEIIAWRFCQSASPAEMFEVLEGINRRCEELGMELPSMLVAENCCQIEKEAHKAMPDIQICLDVYHFMMRAILDKGGAGSESASSNTPPVHTAQLKHLHKGCLSRQRQDIATDGSRIEGSHKGWNSIQRAFASGIELQNALSHDFVLRRNIRIAFSRTPGTAGSHAFARSTFGSHHTRLVDQTASILNDVLHF
ncbi:hypothetical protein B0H14DRAFT_2291039, partial [Mycena olivaceomarginata]